MSAPQHTAQLGSTLRKLIQSQANKQPLTVVQTTCSDNSIDLAQRLGRVISAYSEQCMIMSDTREDHDRLMQRLIHHGTTRPIYGVSTDRVHATRDVLECPRTKWMAYNDVLQREGLILSTHASTWRHRTRPPMDALILHNVERMKWEEFERVKRLGKRLIVIATSEDGRGLLGQLLSRRPHALFLGDFKAEHHEELPPESRNPTLAWPSSERLQWSRYFSPQLQRGLESLEQRSLGGVCVDTLKEDVRHIEIAHWMANAAQQLLASNVRIRQPDGRQTPLNAPDITILCSTKQQKHTVRHQLSHTLHQINVLTGDATLPRSTQLILTHYHTGSAEAGPQGIQALSGMLSRKHIPSLVFWEEVDARAADALSAQQLNTTHVTKTILRSLSTTPTDNPD